MFRCVTMHNLAVSFMLPCLVAAITLFVTGRGIPGLALCACLLVLYRARFVYRAEFARNVYRIWFMGRRAARDSVLPNRQVGQ